MVGNIIPIKHILYQCSPQAASIIGNTWPRQTQTPECIALNASLINSTISSLHGLVIQNKYDNHHKALQF